jgi:hypothetical protein
MEGKPMSEIESIPGMGLPFYDTLDDPLTYWALGLNGTSFDRIIRSIDGIHWTTWRTFTSADPTPHIHTIFRDSQGRIYISGIGGKPDAKYVGLFRIAVAPGQAPADASFETVFRFVSQVNNLPTQLVSVRPWGILEDSQGNIYVAEYGDTKWGTLWRIPRDGSVPYVVFLSDTATMQFVGGHTDAVTWSRPSWMRHIHGIGCSPDDRIFFVTGDGGSGPKTLARGLWVFDPFRNTVDLTVPGQPYGNPPDGRPGVYWQEDWTTQWTDVAFTGPDELYMPADTVGSDCEIWQYRWLAHWASIATLNPPLTEGALSNAKFCLRAATPNELWFTLPTDDQIHNDSTGLYRMNRQSIDSSAWTSAKVLGPLPDNLHIQDLAVDRFGRIPSAAEYVFVLAWSWRNAWQQGDEYRQSCTMYRVPRSASGVP